MNILDKDNKPDGKIKVKKYTVNLPKRALVHLVDAHHQDGQGGYYEYNKENDTVDYYIRDKTDDYSKTRTYTLEEAIPFQDWILSTYITTINQKG